MVNQAKKPCATCSGTGRCQGCKGTGRRHAQFHPGSDISKLPACTLCRSSGLCLFCHGNGS